jgi:hypothetical protein
MTSNNCSGSEIEDILPSIHFCMRFLVNSDTYSDFTFFVGPNRVPFHAHKCILAARAPHFRELFATEASPSPFPSSPPLASAFSEEVVANIRPDTFLLFLKHLYSDFIPHYSIEEAGPLLLLSQKYGLQTLENDIARKIIKSNKSFRNGIFSKLPTLLADFSSLVNSTELSDVVLICGSKIVPAQRDSVRSISHYFR